MSNNPEVIKEYSAEVTVDQIITDILEGDYNPEDVKIRVKVYTFRTVIMLVYEPANGL